jgi:hypothetical protein
MVKMRSLLGWWLVGIGAAQAQAPNFEGLSLQVAGGYQSHAPVFFDYKTSGAANGLSTQTDRTQGIPLIVSAAYTWSFTQQVSLGLTYDHHVLKTSAARQSLYTNGSFTSGGTIRFKNQQQLSLVSGVVPDASTMVYGKLGIAKASTDATNDDGSAAENLNFSGWAWGVGAKRFVSLNQFAFAEYNRVLMSDTLRSSDSLTYQTSSKGSVLVVGMGWQF